MITQNVLIYNKNYAHVISICSNCRALFFNSIKFELKMNPVSYFFNIRKTET